MITPRVISLDLDDTLWPVAPVIAAAETALLSWLRARHPRAVHGHDVDSMRSLRARIAAQFPEQSHDMTFLRRRALAEQFAAAGYPDVPDAVTRSVGAPIFGPSVASLPVAAGSPVEEALEIFFAERNRVEFYADVRPALIRLRARYRLFAVSNGNADLERCGIGDLFDGHITASGAGAAKPDARIFAHLLREAGVEPIEVLHIGDDPLADVVGATRAGMQAVWLNREARRWPSQFAPPPRTVTTLAEII
jgi:FMN hydrolase / 5-amino-6-(5-phospho-D-ribitylamino)uracil phosphatase